MLHEFLSTNRKELIDRCRSKVAERSNSDVAFAELEHGITMFLEQLIKTLQIEQTSVPMDSRSISGPSGGENEALSEMGRAAARHGLELMQQGVTIDQVVHDYGDLCQAVTDLAFERGAPIDVDEFRTLNRCLDNAIAAAVSEYTSQRDSLLTDKGVQSLNERLGSLAHELRNRLFTANLALAAIKSGGVAIGGATGAVLERSLIQIGNLIDGTLADVRVTAGMAPRSELVRVADFLTDIRVGASLEAEARRCRFLISVIDPRLAVEVDRDLLYSAVSNLLQNAFRCTREESDVTLNVRAIDDQVLIDVEDQCGGLPAGAADRMFEAFQQAGSERSGMGLGLSICRRSVEAIHGEVGVRDLPGEGCIFTITLPRREFPEAPEGTAGTLH